MEKLWSPWRSNYIDSFKNPEKDGKCVFCSAQKLEINDPDSLILDKGESSFIMMNLYPYNNGHLMIIPYRHISDYLELKLEELTEIFELNKKAMIVLRKIMSPHGFNFGANIGLPLYLLSTIFDSFRYLFLFFCKLSKSFKNLSAVGSAE